MTHQPRRLKTGGTVPKPEQRVMFLPWETGVRDSEDHRTGLEAFQSPRKAYSKDRKAVRSMNVACRIWVE
jgi:hypothetical protein